MFEVKIKESDRNDEFGNDFDRLEDVLFNVAYLLTIKTIDKITIEKFETYREKA
jgi:hypothetical protein